MAAGFAYVAALLAIDIRALPSSYTLTITPTPHPPPRFQFFGSCLGDDVSYFPSSVTAAGSDVYGEG